MTTSTPIDNFKRSLGAAMKALSGEAVLEPSLIALQHMWARFFKRRGQFARLFSTALLFTLSLNSPVHAQADVPEDRSLILACIEAQTPADIIMTNRVATLQTACFGLVEAGCLAFRQKAGAPDYYRDSLICSSREIGAWDSLLNRSYKDILSSISSKDKKDVLRKAQRAWILYRDMDCDDRVSPGGTGEASARSTCLAHVTAHRFLTLKYSRDW